MMLLSLHLFAISALIFIIWGVAYRMGKEEGIRLSLQINEDDSEEESPSKTSN